MTRLSTSKAWKSKDGKKLVIACPYQHRLVLKDELGASWNGHLKKWTMPYTLPSVMKLMTEHCQLCENTLFDFDEDIQKLLDRKQSEKRKRSSDSLIFKTPPFDYQRRMVELFLSWGGKALIFDETGVGKSKQAIDCSVNCGATSILIVSNKSSMHNFKNQVLQHSNLIPIVLDGPVKDRKLALKSDDYDVFIVNYDVLAKMQNDLLVKGFDCVIFDEIHLIKDPNANRSKVAKILADTIQYRIGLTATPSGNTKVDVFMPFNVIDDTIFGKNFWTFKNQFFVHERRVFGSRSHNVFESLKPAREDEFKRLVAKRSRRIKAESVSNDFPEVMSYPLTIELTKAQWAEYKDIMSGELVGLPLAFELQKYTSKLKLPALIDYVQSLDGKKALVFCRFTSTIDMVKEAIPNAVVLDGRAKGDEWQSFQKDDSPIMICQCQMGTGWEVPQAPVSIFFEMDFSYINRKQCEGRNRRSGHTQYGPVFRVDMIADGTFDTVIHDTISEKDVTASDVMEFVEGLMKGGEKA